jgi:ADP-heptose:LPS heptosyltransferase
MSVQQRYGQNRLPVRNDGLPSIFTEPARIAVFQALNLGDLLCATPALRALRRRFAQSEIAFIGRPWAAQLVHRLASIDRFIAFPGHAGIAESPSDPHPVEPCLPRFDLALQMHGSGEISNGFAQSLAPRSAGYGPPGERRLSIPLAWVENEPEPLRWLRLVAAVGAAPAGHHFDLPISPSERERAVRHLPGAARQPLIGLHVGASDPTRRWPTDRFAELADQLIDHYDATIILTGAYAERSLTDAVRRDMRGSVIDLAGQTSLGELAAVIGSLDLLVSNDTGVSHVAAAMRTRSVILFGSTPPERWAPLDRERHAVLRATDFSPGRDGAAALAALPVAPVFAACRAALATAPRVHLHRVAKDRVSWVG